LVSTVVSIRLFFCFVDRARRKKDKEAGGEIVFLRVTHDNSLIFLVISLCSCRFWQSGIDLFYRYEL